MIAANEEAGLPKVVTLSEQLTVRPEFVAMDEGCGRPMLVAADKEVGRPEVVAP